MYQIRPISAVPELIDLPKCMYRIKPLNGISNFGEGLNPSIKRVKMDPELEAIEVRQLEVIHRLRKLRDNVDELIGKCGGSSATQLKSTALKKTTVNNSSSKTTPVASSSKLSKQFVLSPSLPDEIVIEANPARPPLSVVFLRKLSPKLRVVAHTHSSCKEKVDPKILQLFTSEPETFNSTVRVVWKSVPDSRLTPLSLASSGVYGESNVARYISRLLCSSEDTLLNYDALSMDDLIIVDGVLDTSDKVDCAPDEFLGRLQEYVQKRGSRGAGAAKSSTVADLVGYSTLSYLKNKGKSPASLPKVLLDWMNCLTNEVSALS